MVILRNYNQNLKSFNKIKNFLAFKNKFNFAGQNLIEEYIKLSPSLPRYGLKQVLKKNQANKMNYTLSSASSPIYELSKHPDILKDIEEKISKFNSESPNKSSGYYNLTYNKDEWKDKILLLSGCTASGKSSVAFNLASPSSSFQSCLKNNSEIILSDAVQIYEDFNIMSTKPNHEELENIPHHCVNIIKFSDILFDKNNSSHLTEGISANNYSDYAFEAVNRIKKMKGKVPLFVGGNTMWTDWALSGKPIPSFFNFFLNNFNENFSKDDLYSLFLLYNNNLEKNKLNVINNNEVISYMEKYVKKSLENYEMKISSLNKETLKENEKICSICNDGNKSKSGKKLNDLKKVQYQNFLSFINNNKNTSFTPLFTSNLHIDHLPMNIPNYEPLNDDWEGVLDIVLKFREKLTHFLREDKDLKKFNLVGILDYLTDPLKISLMDLYHLDRTYIIDQQLFNFLSEEKDQILKILSNYNALLNIKEYEVKNKGSNISLTPNSSTYNKIVRVTKFPDSYSRDRGDIIDSDSFNIYKPYQPNSKFVTEVYYGKDKIDNGTKDAHYFYEDRSKNVEESNINVDFRKFFLLEHLPDSRLRINMRCLQLLEEGGIKEIFELILKGSLSPQTIRFNQPCTKGITKAIGYRDLLYYFLISGNEDIDIDTLDVISLTSEEKQIIKEKFKHITPQKLTSGSFDLSIDYNLKIPLRSPNFKNFKSMFSNFCQVTRKYTKRQKTWHRRLNDFLFLKLYRENDLNLLEKQMTNYKKEVKDLNKKYSNIYKDNVKVDDKIANLFAFPYDHYLNSDSVLNFYTNPSNSNEFDGLNDEIIQKILNLPKIRLSDESKQIDKDAVNNVTRELLYYSSCSREEFDAAIRQQFASSDILLSLPKNPKVFLDSTFNSDLERDIISYLVYNDKIQIYESNTSYMNDYTYSKKRKTPEETLEFENHKQKLKEKWLDIHANGISQEVLKGDFLWSALSYDIR